MRKNTTFNLTAYNTALAARGLTDRDVAQMMEIGEATLWRKKTGKTDFYAREMMALKEKAHLTEQEARAIFFSGVPSK